MNTEMLIVRTKKAGRHTRKLENDDLQDIRGIQGVAQATWLPMPEPSFGGRDYPRNEKASIRILANKDAIEVIRNKGFSTN